MHDLAECEIAKRAGKLNGAVYPHRVISAFPDHRGIRVAFLSRHAVQEQVDRGGVPQGPALDIHDLTGTGGSTGGFSSETDPAGPGRFCFSPADSAFLRANRDAGTFREAEIM
jgi:hypothetical protein